MFRSLAGLLCFAALAWCVSENRRGVRLRMVVCGLLIQVALAFVLLRLPFFKSLFLALNRTATMLAEATRAGTSLVFGYLDM